VLQEQWAHRNVHYDDETLKPLEKGTEYSRPLKRREGTHTFYHMLKETIDPTDMISFLSTLQAGLPLPIVCVDQKPKAPPLAGDRLAVQCLDAELVGLTQASHFAHVDATDRFSDTVLPFLQEQP
jgi:hypothetical protein